MSLIRTWLSKLIPSIGGVIGTVVLFTVLMNGDGLLTDGDTAWHIKAGDYVLENRAVPKVDVFSYRKYGRPWIDHEWLSDLIFSVVHRMAGLNGIVVLSAGVIALTSIVLFRMLQFYRFNILTVTAVTLLATFTTSIDWLARPHLFSLCLSVIWYWLLEVVQTNPHTKKLWLLPLLMLLWANLHGGFLISFVLLGIYGMGNLLSFIWPGASEREFYKTRLDAFLKIGLICLGVALVNPYGPRQLIFPFETIGSTMTWDIIEWWSPNFHNFTFYEFYILALFTSILIARQRVSAIEIILLLFALHSSLVAQRFIPLFAILCAPILGRQVEALYRSSVSEPAQNGFLHTIRVRFRNSVDRLQSLNDRLRHYGFTFALCAAVFLIACNGGSFLGRQILDFRFKGANYPIAAVDFLKRNPLPGNMFNSYSYGGYLIYVFYPDPRYRVFVDGRSIVDGEDYTTEFQRVNFARPEWKYILRMYHVNWIIYPAGSWLSTLILQGNEWKLIYSDRMTNIFIKNVPANQSIIDKFPHVRSTL